MKLLYKIFAFILVLIVLLILFVQIAGNKTFDAPYPEITASTDPDIIARGEYLVFGPAHCGSCHGTPGTISAMDDGKIKPLSGGTTVDIPPIATLHAFNLTPDVETGIGALTDGEIARVLRYNISHTGRLMLPVMEYSQMSDEDITAIISYLRAQPAVKHKVEKSSYKFVGKALLAFGMLKPASIEKGPVASVSKTDTLAYGKYLASGVANCLGCHTNIDVMSGEYLVPPFAGGFHFTPDALTEGFGYTSPNLTPDQETGIMAKWTEEVFINRFKSGRIHATSPMPWGAMSKMDTSDLVAIYQYLHSLEPVNNAVGQIVFHPEE